MRRSIDTLRGPKPSPHTLSRRRPHGPFVLIVGSHSSSRRESVSTDMAWLMWSAHIDSTPEGSGMRADYGDSSGLSGAALPDLTNLRHSPHLGTNIGTRSR